MAIKIVMRGGVVMASSRGLASASQRTRREVGRQGGKAPHPKGRGLQNADRKTRERVARKGGLSHRSR